jgi:hypothetical protein
MEVLELREELSEARAAGRAARVAEMASAVGARREQAMAEVGAALEAGDHGAAARALVAVRYYDRFLEEASLQPAGGAAHAG